MVTTLDILSLVFLFIILGVSADFAVKKIKFLASILKIRLFGIGIILGIITTLPELLVGINSIVAGAASLAIGNILGGIMVLFGLITGGSILLNNKIKTIHNLNSLIPAVLVIVLPLFLGFDGNFGTIDGLIMIFSYVVLLVYLYMINFSLVEQTLIIKKSNAIKSILLTLGAIILVIISSRWIVGITINMLSNMGLSEMIVGILFFSIGTNLPEITIMLTSWRRKAAELSLSHIISAAFTHTLVLGLLAIMSPMNFTVTLAYYSLVIFIILTSILIVKFCYSEESLNKKEGIILLLVYVIFVLTNIFLIKF